MSTNLPSKNEPNPEHTDGEGEGADGDDEGDEDAPSSPKPSPIKDKGKGKAKVKKHVPVIAGDKDDVEDDHMDVVAEPSRATSRPADNDVEMNAPDVQTVVAARPKPRPKPVPVKKTSKSEFTTPLQYNVIMILICVSAVAKVADGNLTHTLTFAH
jgi:hypothetical protein